MGNKRPVSHGAYTRVGLLVMVKPSREGTESLCTTKIKPARFDPGHSPSPDPGTRSASAL
jgi:hypothetical protein